MNTFHWHLTEDQGWRIEIKQYPRLTEVGAWRKETLVGHYAATGDRARYDGMPHGGFYTQDDVRESWRMPRRATSTSCPRSRCPATPRRPSRPTRSWATPATRSRSAAAGASIEDVYNVEESTLRFLQNVLDEVLELFPSEFIHIGGDEVSEERSGRKARPCPGAHARIGPARTRTNCKATSSAAWTHFLTARGRRLIGWDEILEGGLAPNATVMSWRGEEGGIAAARAGHDVVMAPEHLYLPGLLPDRRHRAASRWQSAAFSRLRRYTATSPSRAALPPEEATTSWGRRGSCGPSTCPRHARRIHGVPAPVRAGRSGLDAGGTQRLRRLPGPAARTPRTAWRAGCELPQALT